MALDKQYINGLLRLYFNNAAAHQQREALFDELEMNADDPEWEDILLDILQETEPDQDYDREYWQQKLNAITKQKARIVPLTRRRVWYKIAAAAVIILAVGLAVILSLSKGKNEKPPIAGNPTPLQKDIAPGMQGAVLTLSNGKQVILDSTRGNVANEGGVAVINRDGSVTYGGKSPFEGGTGDVVYNTVSTPRARQYQLTLQDGTKVWLNAESSIRFPTAFKGNSRVVEITGEAYFEVAHNAAKPFIVSVNDMQVEVLGTHFNINSYADEGSIKTTLLEGKVRVSRNGNIALLKPGEQAVASSNAQLTIYEGVDLDVVVAWKNGYFSFQNANLQTIMREAARWYDVDVTYQGAVPAVQFSGEIGRTLTLTQFLRILDKTRIHYTIEGKKLIITQ